MTDQTEPAAWTPPPPGDRREQLPAAILALIDIPPYTSTACEAASLLAWQMPKRKHRRAELGDHADRLHSRCRINNKFTGKSCSCLCHQQAATDPDDLTGAWTPDPPIGCLTVAAEPALTPAQEHLAQSGVDTPGCDCDHDGMGVSWHGDDCPWRRNVLDGPGPERTPSQRPGLRDDIAKAARTVPLRLGPNAIAIAQRGEAITLNMGEADHIADAVMTLIYREWPWLRAAAEERDQSAATLAAITTEAARRGVISIDGIRKITGPTTQEQQ
jgi:hypothetical protein